MKISGFGIMRGLDCFLVEFVELRLHKDCV